MMRSDESVCILVLGMMLVGTGGGGCDGREQSLYPYIHHIALHGNTEPNPPDCAGIFNPRGSLLCVLSIWGPFF